MYFRLQPFKNKEIADKKKVYLMKMLVLVFGSLCIVLSFLVKYIGAVLQSALTIFGVIGGPVSAVFTLGIFLPFVNQKVINYNDCSDLLLIEKKTSRFSGCTDWSRLRLSFYIFDWIRWAQTTYRKLTYVY